MWLNQSMFARKIRVEYETHGEKRACPLKWMDSFSMRNFTNASVFDDTLPVSDGLMEIGAKVPTVSLRDNMEEWFRKKSYLPAGATLVVTEIERPNDKQKD
jgi:hypothetical protein